MTTDAETHRHSAGIVERDLRPEHEHSQALANGRRETRVHQQLETVVVDAAEYEIGEHAALRRAPRRVLRCARYQRHDIVGQLPVQECRRVGASDAQHVKRREVADYCLVLRGDELRTGVAERNDGFSVERCAMRGEEIGPGGHGDRVVWWRWG